MDAEGKRPGQIVSANLAAEIHGYTLEEMLSLSIADLDTPESARNLQARIERVLKGETVQEETDSSQKRRHRASRLRLTPDYLTWKPQIRPCRSIET